MVGSRYNTTRWEVRRGGDGMEASGQPTGTASICGQKWKDQPAPVKVRGQKGRDDDILRLVKVPARLLLLKTTPSAGPPRKVDGRLNGKTQGETTPWQLEEEWWLKESASGKKSGREREMQRQVPQGALAASRGFQGRIPCMTEGNVLTIHVNGARVQSVRERERKGGREDKETGFRSIADMASPGLYHRRRRLRPRPTSQETPLGPMKLAQYQDNRAIQQMAAAPEFDASNAPDLLTVAGVLDGTHEAQISHAGGDHGGETLEDIIELTERAR
ncbi:hypothetical protein FB45DRAFT_866713 [Roridomyces roridus]|uniref:Uncharacterized protein n=1 Tax=Roridomyces roridus TaxID=1738132 RepID=A0AAD7FNK9_9AGAR|nr:hypothetical protein FB45DRAFT_866713 [Roridomyces roridus]